MDCGYEPSSAPVAITDRCEVNEDDQDCEDEAGDEDGEDESDGDVQADGHISSFLIINQLMENEQGRYVAPLSNPTRLVDSNRFRNARLILFVYFSFVCLFVFFFFFVNVSRPESPARPEGRIRTGARFT